MLRHNCDDNINKTRLILTGSKRSVFWSAKFVPQGNDYGRHPQKHDSNQVEKLGLKIAIETIVEPWHERSHDE